VVSLGFATPIIRGRPRLQSKESPPKNRPIHFPITEFPGHVNGLAPRHADFWGRSCRWVRAPRSAARGIVIRPSPVSPHGGLQGLTPAQYLARHHGGSPRPPHCLEPGPSLVRPARRGYEPRHRVSDDPFRRGGIYCRRGLGLASRAADGSRVGPLGSIEPSKDRGSHAGLGLRHVRLTGGFVLCDSTKDWQPRPCSWLVAPA
jgi:hypothetical protein